MQTRGYYCDQCRRKYVAHRCDPHLPCGHHISGAIWVEAQRFGRTQEQVLMVWNYEGINRVTLSIGEKGPERDVVYCNADARMLWGQTVQTLGQHLGKLMDLGAWLRQQPDQIIRAFLSRWESFQEPPLWKQIQQSTVGLKDKGGNHAP